MLKSNIISNEVLQAEMREALEILSDTVSKTLGPYGSTTIIENRLGDHHITKDGYTVLKNVYFESNIARVVYQFVMKTSFELVRQVGDGSSSSIVIANALYKSIVDIIKELNTSPKDVMDLLTKVSADIEAGIRKKARRISDNMEELKSIATVSTNNDINYGNLIHEIFTKIGRYGFINLDVSKTTKTTYEILNGYELPRGYSIQSMVNDADSKLATHTNPKVLLVDDMLTESDLEGWLADLVGQVCQASGTPLLIIAKDMDSSVRTFFYFNTEKNNVPVVVTELSMDSRDQLDRLRDLETLVGATALRKSRGEKVDPFVGFDLSRLGSCAKVVSSENYTRIIDGQGDSEEINNRIGKIEEEIFELNIKEDHVDYSLDVFRLRKRIAGLQSSMATLYVGGDSHVAKTADKDLLEDAIAACRSALEHGYCVGGNLIIRNVIYELLDGNVSDEEHTVLRYLSEASTAPFIQVLSNKNVDDNHMKTLNKCFISKSIYNLKSGQFESEDETKIINSVQTDILIMRSAISIVGLLALSNQMIGLNTLFN